MVEIIELKKNCKLTDKDIIDDLLQPIDKDADFVTGNNNYVWFYLIAKYFRPKVIAETGTRFGYSMKAFVTGAWHESDDYSIWSYDCECDGIKTLDIFENYFRSKMGIKDIHINRSNIRKLKSLDIPKSVDLFFVDAEHTTEGCYHECCLGWEALRASGVMVIDDVNYEVVKAGVERFIINNQLVYYYLPSLGGIYLIIK